MISLEKHHFSGVLSCFTLLVWLRWAIACMPLQIWPRYRSDGVDGSVLLGDLSQVAFPSLPEEVSGLEDIK